MLSPFSAVGIARRSMEFEMPIHVAAQVEASRPDAAGEVRVTVTGWLELSGAVAEWIVRFPTADSVGGVRETRTIVPLMAPASAIQIPPRTIRGTVAGPSTLWLDFVDGRGRRLGERVYLGRRLPCTRTVRTGLAMPVAVTAATRLAPPQSARLEACGALHMAGLAARLALSGDISFAPERPVSGPFAPHFAILSEVSIIPVGDTRATARHPVAGDGPQDCWLSVQWRYGNGAPIGAEQLIGRCRQPIGIAAN